MFGIVFAAMLFSTQAGGIVNSPLDTIEIPTRSPCKGEHLRMVAGCSQICMEKCLANGGGNRCYERCCN